MLRLLITLIPTLFLFCSCKTNIKEEEYPSLYRILIGEKYGFMDASGKLVIEPQFDDANLLFVKGLCYAKIGKKQGLINSSGNFVAFSDYLTYSYAFGEGSIFCESNVPNGASEICYDGNNLYFLIDGEDENGNRSMIITNAHGDTIGEPHNYIGGFHNGMCLISDLNDKWGYMDTRGEPIIDLIYDDADDFSDGLAHVKKDGENMFIDKSGNCIFYVDSVISTFHCNRAVIIEDGEKYLVDKQGKTICHLVADYVYDFDPEDNLATIIRDNKASKIDTLGNIVLSTNYDWIGSFINGIAPIAKNKKIGFINFSNKEIIKPEYEYYAPFFILKNPPIRIVAKRDFSCPDLSCHEFYDTSGNLLWKDMPIHKKNLTDCYTKKDFIEYFDSRLPELDPIEGIYYVSYSDFYQNRDNPNIIGLNSTTSKFCALYHDGKGFAVEFLDNNKTWVNQFIRIGESNSYAITKCDPNNNYSSEGRVTIDDFTQFDFKLSQGHNNYYNFFVTYSFTRDYPDISEIEKIQNAEWTGSGFAIADGYIATNYHVTNGAKSIRIKGVNGNMKESYKGFVVASDKEHDISIVKIIDTKFKGFDNIPYKIGKTNVEVGDDVFVLGYPLTSTMGEEIKLTEGIISASSGYKGNSSMYQISAAVQPGNSGGPLFKSDGTVIGIVCGKHSDTENANYAVKIAHLYNLISSSDMGIEPNQNGDFKKKNLSSIVKKIKSHIYLIECSSK